MSRNFRLIFAVSTMLSAVAVAPLASAQPPQAQPKPAPKAPTFKGPMGVKITPKPQPVFVHHVPVFIPGHPVFIPHHPQVIVRGGGYRPYGPSYSGSYAPGPSYGSASASAPAPAPTYQALGLAWNHAGAWVVEQAATLDEASANALAKCNAQYGGCELSAQSVNEQSFACLAVARGAEDTHRLFASRAGSEDELQASVQRSLSDAGATGNVEYAACNAASS